MVCSHVWMLLSTVPIILILVLGSVMYDGWRHLYFTYPGFCGLDSRFSFLRTFSKRVRLVRDICHGVLWIAFPWFDSSL